MYCILNSVKKVLNKIRLHYPNNMNEKYEEFQNQYIAFLKDYRTDFDGKRISIMAKQGPMLR